MADAQSVLLALILGFGFGLFAYRMGTTWQRLAIFLFVLWVFQSATQHAYRIVALGETPYQLTFVFHIRTVFAITACAVVWFLNRRDLRRM